MDKDLWLYDSHQRKKRKFQPLNGKKVGFYSCGPTTYDFLHIGNARALVVGDLLNRWLRILGYDVTFVRNFTDIDDKILQAAEKRGIDPKDHAQQFINECLQDMRYLKLLKPDYTPLATEHIAEMIEMIEVLVEKGFAYHKNGEVFFHIAQFKDYGKFSGRDINQLKQGARVEVDLTKKHSADFVLWKPALDGELGYDSPWGKGRPGWHIECSAMSRKYLGNQLDLHHGGIDLIFPHHENEVAQSEAYSGEKFCQYWCHNEFLHFGKDKMSKSLGNVVTIRQFVENYGGDLLRYMLVKFHYRTIIEWNQDLLVQSIVELEKVNSLYQDFLTLEKLLPSASTKDNQQALVSKIQEHCDLFSHQMSQDLNTPLALSYIFAIGRLIRKSLFEVGSDSLQKDVLNTAVFNKLKEFIQLVQLSLGLMLTPPSELNLALNKARMLLSGVDAKEQLDEESILKFIEQRKIAKQNKKFAEADGIRNQLKSQGVILEDHPDGSCTWKYGSK